MQPMTLPVVSPFISWVELLAQRHTRQLMGVATHEGLGTDDALDAVQEAFATFLNLPQARALVEAPDDTAAFLSAIVRNAARNARRRHHRAVPHVAVTQVPIPDPSDSAEALLERAQNHVAVLGCISRLKDLQRSVVTLRMLQELSADEVSKQLGLTPNHLAVILHRAKQLLHECLLESNP
jgi:RNA polymerase sigma-70 factor, ECF subfamily